MSASTLTQFLVDVTRGHRREAFATDPERVLAASALDEPLRRAVREHDMGALWLAGAHPLALLYFARASGWSNERYYRCLDEAAARRRAASPGVTRAAPAAAPAPPEPGPPRTHRARARHDR